LADPPTYPQPGDHVGAGPGPRPTGMPRWVKVFLIIAIVLVLAFIVSQLLGIQHGPRRHVPPGSSGSHTAQVEQEAGQP
jgi:hypothetical protein